MMDPIESEFEYRGVVRGGILFLGYDDSFDFVARCREMKRGILGIDSFLLGENATEPVMEHSVDFGELADQNDCWDEAIVFLTERKRYGFYFEIVIGNSQIR